VPRSDFPNARLARHDAARWQGLEAMAQRSAHDESRSD
jgi:hypothetical protein